MVLKAEGHCHESVLDFKPPMFGNAFALLMGRKSFLQTPIKMGPLSPFNDINHNVFRLDKDGNVVWQVQR